MTIRIAQRAVGTRATRKKILIVCEGEKTEPEYFRSFRVHSQICDIRGFGDNTISLVNRAKKLNEQGDFLEVWCVFDRDSFPLKNVEAALNSARGFGFKCAFSSESFELWYILHFDYLDTKITRSQYCKKLTESLGKKYKKNDSEMYKTLLERQPEAIKRAKTLRKQICPKGEGLHAAQPITLVYELVERLNKLADSIK